MRKALQEIELEQAAKVTIEAIRHEIDTKGESEPEACVASVSAILSAYDREQGFINNAN